MNDEFIPSNSLQLHTQSVAGLATQLGYDGDLTVGSLEDGIRLYQRRTIEDLFELGKRLLLLKEQCQHGEFINRVELLGFDKSIARKLMVATLKFSKVETSPLLKNVKSQSKLLELIILDDDEIDVIEHGGSIGNVNLDSIETMSVRELKKALRDAKAETQQLKESDAAKDQILQKKDQKLNEMDTKLTKLQSAIEIEKREASEADQLEQKALEMMQKATLTFLDAASRFNTDMATALESCQSIYITEQFQANIRMTYQSIATRCNESGLPIDFAQMATPDWLIKAMQDDDTQPTNSENEE